MSALVPDGRFRKNGVVICCFWGLFDGCFSDVWISAGFLVRKIVLLLLGFARNYLSEYAPEAFSLSGLVSLAIFNLEHGLLVAPC